MKGPKRIDLTGKRFGNLTVICYDHNMGYTHYWKCLCDCGNYCLRNGNSLRSGAVISCGCERKKRAQKSNTRHGQCHTKLYQVWHKMKQRCINENLKMYKYYGGRGISYAPEWEKFESFYEWSKGKYKEGLSLDRIDNNGNYCPDNCRFVTMFVQARNTRSNHLITYNGLTKTISEWAEITGINKFTICTRIETQGWDEIRAITTPIDKRCHKKSCNYED